MEQYIQPFLQTTSTVFKQMLDCEIRPDRAYFVGKEAFNNWDISGLIALTGEVKGLVAISMKYPTASRMTSHLIKEQENGASSVDMKDAIGELVNIIAGNVKKELEDQFQIVISLPRVISGKAHAVVIPNDRMRLLCIPFSIYESDTICLSINIEDDEVAELVM